MKNVPSPLVRTAPLTLVAESFIDIGQPLTKVVYCRNSDNFDYYIVLLACACSLSKTFGQFEDNVSPFLQPKSFWDIWDLSDLLSSCVALSFQWVPGHAGLSGNERADSLATTGATLPVTHVTCPLALTIAR